MYFTDKCSAGFLRSHHLQHRSVGALGRYCLLGQRGEQIFYRIFLSAKGRTYLVTTCACETITVFTQAFRWVNTKEMDKNLPPEWFLLLQKIRSL